MSNAKVTGRMIAKVTFARMKNTMPSLAPAAGWQRLVKDPSTN
jgi:hypothetical protein